MKLLADLRFTNVGSVLAFINKCISWLYTY